MARILALGVALDLGAPAGAADLEVWDLASLHGMSEAIVLVDELRSSGIDEPATARVTRVYKGRLSSGDGIAFIPWAVDFGSPDAGRGDGSEAKRAVLFLERQDGGPLWSLLPSGARLVDRRELDGIAEVIWRLAPRGARRYAWTRARGEAVESERYGLRALEEDLAVCRERLAEAARFAVGPLGIDGANDVDAQLSLESARAFGRGGARSSLLASALAERLVALGDIGRALEWRERLPHPGAGAALRFELARATELLGVLLPRLRWERGLAELERALRFLVEEAERLPATTREIALVELVDGLLDGAYPDGVKVRAELAIARLLPRTFIVSESDDRMAKLLEHVARAESGSVHRVAPVLAASFPERIGGSFESWHPLYAGIEVVSASAREISGRIRLTRVASAHELGAPRLRIQRLDGERVSLDLERPVSMEERLLKRGSEGSGVYPFRLGFEPGMLERGAYRLRIAFERIAPDRTTDRSLSAPTSFLIER